MAQVLEIWQIQGAGLVSPYVGTVVETQNNIVTAVGPDFFYMQTPHQRSDNNTNTSDGILVYTEQSHTLSVGDHVNVSGTVAEFEENTEITIPNLSWSLAPDDDSFVSPALLDQNFPTANLQEVPDQERVEGMLVKFNAMVCAPSNFSGIAALSTREQRPFREPGILPPGLPDLPVWDGNPEIFWFDPNALGAANNRFLGFGMRIDCPQGIMWQSDSRYYALPLDYQVENSTLVQAVRPKTEKEITLGSFNVLLLGFSGDTDERLQKIGRYITQSLRSPDILALQEVADLNVLQELIFVINQLSPGTNYHPYFFSGTGDINTAFLVKSHLPAPTVTQLGKNEFISLGGVLHDRPPLLLEMNLPTNPVIPIRVLNLHLRSPNGITGSNANYVRTKRHEQAISVANMVENLRDENLLLLGDFNAFQFTDGYVDVHNQISGQPSLGALFPVEPIVSPPLINQTISAQEEEEHYSYVFRGSAQLIDHCLSNDLVNVSVNELSFARGNADAADAYMDNEFLVESTSDHDGFVVFLETAFPLSDREILRDDEVQLFYANPLMAGASVELRIPNGRVDLALINSMGQVIQSYDNLQGNQRILLPSHLPQGFYGLRLEKEGRYRMESILVQ